MQDEKPGKKPIPPTTDQPDRARPDAEPLRRAKPEVPVKTQPEKPTVPPRRQTPPAEPIQDF